MKFDPKILPPLALWLNRMRVVKPKQDASSQTPWALTYTDLIFSPVELSTTAIRHVYTSLNYLRGRQPQSIGNLARQFITKRTPWALESRS